MSDGDPGAPGADAAPPTSPLRAELEAALLRALAASHRALNDTYWKGALRSPAITLVSSSTKLGEWRPAERTLAFSRALVVDRPWGIVIEVLKHEMAHQYVSEVLGEPDGTPHGPAFQAVCERLGIDGRAAGLPEEGGDAAPGAEEARVLGRIAKLLALAESPHRNEAEAAMAEAQRLMLKHNLEAAPARSRYGFRHLGRPTGRVSAAERILANVLCDHFFVEVIWVSVWRAREGKRGSVLEVCGTPVNLEMAEYVHGFLTHTAERLWEEYRRARGLRSRRDRLTFVAGVMAGFRDKLEAERRKHARAGLVWVGDADLARYQRRRHPHVRWTRHQGAARTEAHAHGREAGRGVVLSRPVTARGGGARRLLPGR